MAEGEEEVWSRNLFFQSIMKSMLDMMQAMCNTTSDGAIALIVAKRVGELDMAKYTSD